MKVNQGESVIRLVLKINLSTILSMKRSRSELAIHSFFFVFFIVFFIGHTDTLNLNQLEPLRFSEFSLNLRDTHLFFGVDVNFIDS